MKVEELRRLIEQRGYEVKAIKIFKKTFHVTYWHPDYKAKAFYKTPIEKVTWEQIEQGYPKIDQ